MIHYLDKTFCTAKNCTKFGASCSRSLTDEVRANAVKWWGSDGEAPICTFSEPESLDCYDPKKMDK